MEKQIKKIKWIYSGELLLIAVVLLTLGILELLHVITLKDRFQLIFKIITLVGATWLVVDFFWTRFSPKRLAKNCLSDKVMMLPLAVYLYCFDIIGFVSERPYEYYQIGVPIVFFYIACAYIFQGIYHYYHPIPMVIEMIEEAKAEIEAKEKAAEEAQNIPNEEESNGEENNEQ